MGYLFCSRPVLYAVPLLILTMHQEIRTIFSMMILRHSKLNESSQYHLISGPNPECMKKKLVFLIIILYLS